MRHALPSALSAALSIVFLSSAASAAPVKLDKTHSKVGFTAETLLFDVDGEFTEYALDVEGDPATPEQAKVTLTIDVNSIDTKNKKRDDHLKSPDFFDASTHPTIKFSSTSIKKRGNQLIVKGKLTMHGTTRLITIPLKVAKGKNGAGVDTTTYKGKVTIDRNDYGVGTDSIAAKISLDDDVDLKLVVVTFD